MRIGVIATRVAGTDGVSLEIAKWAAILQRLGQQVFYCAGELDPGLQGRVIPAMHFSHPQALEISRAAFGSAAPPPGFVESIRRSAEELYREIKAFIADFRIDRLIVENALAIPMQIPLGLALTNLIADSGIATIAHHHDFYWERERFRGTCIPDLLERCFPPDLPAVQHVVINSLAQASLLKRKGLSGVIVPNIFDFARPAPGVTTFNTDLRASLGLSDRDLFVLQPTRVIRRKGIERSIELVRRLATAESQKALGRRKPVLVITHAAGDEGFEYLAELHALAHRDHIDLRYAAEKFAPAARQDGDGKIYALWDAYVHADLCTYPSIYEGFGNAFLETVYFRLPVMVNRYPVYQADIAPLGFDTVEIDGAVSQQTAEAVLALLGDLVRRSRMVEKNYQIAREHFSYEAVTPLLRQMILAAA